mmetsp:Transcript_19641/g.40013  ORF Transcript_19641/g.40013 Transcript_19641/m.40013 type:complete len:328 (-) Transcript_19641:18-1001(-)
MFFTAVLFICALAVAEHSAPALPSSLSLGSGAFGMAVSSPDPSFRQQADKRPRAHRIIHRRSYTKRCPTDVHVAQYSEVASATCQQVPGDVHPSKASALTCLAETPLHLPQQAPQSERDSIDDHAAASCPRAVTVGPAAASDGKTQVPKDDCREGPEEDLVDSAAEVEVHPAGANDHANHTQHGLPASGTEPMGVVLGEEAAQDQQQHGHLVQHLAMEAHRKVEEEAAAPHNDHAQPHKSQAPIEYIPAAQEGVNAWEDEGGDVAHRVPELRDIGGDVVLCLAELVHRIDRAPEVRGVPQLSHRLKACSATTQARTVMYACFLSPNA